MKTLKIVIDARFYGLEHAGLGRYTTELIKNLGKLDKTNHYFILLRKKYFETLSLPNNWTKVLADCKHYSFSEQINIPKIIKKINPDITHYLHFNAPLFAPKPFIVTIHDMVMHESRGIEATTLLGYQYIIKRIGYKIIFANAVYSAKKIISPSDFVKNQISSHFNINPKKVSITPLGIDESFLENKKNNEKREKSNYFLYVGSAYPHKNLVRLIKAVKNINSKLIIVTSRNVFSKRLKRVVQKLNAQQYIKLQGFVDDRELKKLYSGALAFVYPSTIEGFGFQGLEAMASKTLVAASNIEVFKEVYKDNAIYFDPKSVDSIALCLHQIISMKSSKRDKIINNSYKYAKIFTWKKSAHKTLNVYNEFSKK